ncbi:MAG: 2-oxoacid:acceptor oxidoreductase family protein [Alphaproteobacteria bacterium]|jgi:indolepyruvate ferredoxin oxidoreductase beta subunit|nr:2-oxoacid:acceptor oxidoreductase family protein [Alphaproteobacteria bacterium]MDP6812694.1 2-oxoacid:acceptor oxidoreductase family protein [Alphaproteobacteria bacterium]
MTTDTASAEVGERQQPGAVADPRTRNVLIVGVGGQGVIMISKVLALLCQTQGMQVKQSEVHGMAKRGGVVFSHVRYGAQVWSPTIPMGEADVLIAMEWAEGVRWLPFLRPESGVFIADTQQVIPPFACRNRQFGADMAYATETPAEIIGRVSDGFALDAGRMAEELGNARAGNTILLGTLSATLDFPLDDWLSVLNQFVPKGTEEINRQAFLLGRDWVEKARQDPAGPAGLAPELAPPPIQPDIDVRLEITAEWCKSCDICVKLCPERCLELDEQQIVRLKDPDACTGCRICEWLCPDFAIAVHHDNLAEANA